MIEPRSMREWFTCLALLALAACADTHLQENE